MTRKIHKDFSKYQNCRLIRELSDKFFRCSGALSGKASRRIVDPTADAAGDRGEKFKKISKCFGRRHIGTLRQMDRRCLAD